MALSSSLSRRFGSLACRERGAMLQSTMSAIDVASVGAECVDAECAGEAGVKRRNITRGQCLDIRNGSLQVLYTSLNFKLETG